jgi:DNA recombination protein RmuC
MPAELLAILLPALASAAVFGALVAFLVFSGRLARLRSDADRLHIELELERSNAASRQQSLQQLNEQLRDSFNALAAQALQSNNAEFLRLARENLEQFHIRAEGELAKREKAVENMVKPIRDALDRTEQQVRRMEAERQQAHGALTRHLETMAESHRILQSETRNLVQALRRPEVRGQWGELTLRRLAELSGMVEYCDFVEQETLQAGAGAQRPDMIVRMPDRREIVVDAKTPLDAYLSAVESTDDTERRNHLLRHARNVRARVKELSAKAYWQQLKFSPEFVVLFIPGDQFLSSALEHDHTLIEDALAQQVILATPTSLVALLRAIAYGWRQEAMAENAEVIREIGQEMFARLTIFADHLNRLGRNLNSCVDTYNKTARSFDSRVLPGARKFTELGVTASKDLPAVEQIESMTRNVESRTETDPA